MNWQATIVAVASFAVGFALAYYRGEEKLRDAQLDAAVIRANDGRKAYERLVEAQNALDAMRSERDDVSSQLERVRSADAKRKQRASSDSCRMEREAVTRCEGLLRESSDLLAEGSELLRRNAAIHDATVSATR